MKLTTILAATLPLLAAAVPRGVSDGGRPGDGAPPGAPSQPADWAAGPGPHGQDGHQPPAGSGANGQDFPHPPPAGMDHPPHHEGGDMTGGDANFGHDGHIEHRDLVPRIDMQDHYMEECSTDSWRPEDKVCVRNLIIPKGKITGGCIKRMQSKADHGTAHIVETGIMCKYYEKNDCTGHFMGPYSNLQCDYHYGTFYYAQNVENPQSFYCEIIGFNAGDRQPVNPPKPNPLPPPGDSYNCSIKEWERQSNTGLFYGPKGKPGETPEEASGHNI